MDGGLTPHVYNHTHVRDIDVDCSQSETSGSSVPFSHWSISPTDTCPVSWSHSKTRDPVPRDWPTTPPWSSSGSEEDWTSESPVSEWAPPSPTREPDLFELLNKLQGERLNDQRCTMPGPGGQQSAWTPSRHRLESVLRGSPPYPMVSLPPEGGFWSDPSSTRARHDHSDSDTCPDHDDNPCRTYRAHFLQSEHFNFCGQDDVNGPVVLSVKYYSGDGDNGPGDHIRIVLRLSSGSVHRLVDRDNHPHPSPAALAKLVAPHLTLSSLQPVLCPKASELLVNYDEHVLVNNFKFGVIYQRVGQTHEEALFGNRGHSVAMDRFLDMLGTRVTLAEHSGYRGGLDTQFGQTGQHSVYTEHMGKEIMYHVSTLLPFSETDTQQLQRKRHIGNDIVSIIFQEGNTPFSPDMVTSHFLHAYIVIQPEPSDNSDTLYRVSVTARSDVPYFGPSLPSPPVFRRGPQFREWLLNKLINAETACYKAEKFSKLEQRTRSTLLNNLVEELTSKTHDFLGQQHQETQSVKSESGGIFKNVKKALASRTKSQAPGDVLSSSKPIPKSKSSSSGLSGQDDDMSGGSQGRRSLVGGPRKLVGGAAGKSDSGRGSVGTGSTGRCSVTSSTGRGSSPVSSTSSPDLANRMPSHTHSHQSESDTSSLNSMDCGSGMEQTQVRLSPKKRASLPAFNQPNMSNHHNGGGNHMSLDPGCQEIVSGSVTMVTLEGNVVAGQLSKLQDEISKLKVDKLELLRQNVAAQREVKRLRERELQLQSDLTTASREINRLRMNIKQATGGRDTRDNHSGPGLTSASLASLSLRSPVSGAEPDRDRQH